MKNLLYFTLVAIIFCSCKSNSFLTQKYTHLKHAHNKSETAQLAKQKQEPKTSSRIEKEEYAPVNEEDILFANAAALTEQSYAAAGFTQEKVTLSSKSAKTGFISQVKDKVEQAASGKLTPSKLLKKKFHQAAGLLGTLFQIILFIIILAVLVTVVLILILL